MMSDGRWFNSANFPWNIRLNAAWTWRLLEGLAVACALIWFLSGYNRHERVPGQDSRQNVAAKPAPALTPAFSDSRALVAGAPAPVAKAPLLAVVATVPAVAERRTEVAPMPSPPEATPAARPVTAAAIIPPPPSATTAPAASERGPCPPPDIAIAPLAGGQMQIRVASPCRAGQAIAFRYDNVELKRALPASGSGLFTIDLFAGDRKSLDVTFADATRRVLPVAATDLDKVSKVAVRWRAPVNLDLHIFEHAAGAGQPGHVWANAPSSAEAALKSAAASGRGAGFMNSFDEQEDRTEAKAVDKIEVYTYVHGAQDAGDTVVMALDHETRGSQPSPATCGQGSQAKVDFGVTLLSRKGDVIRAGGVFKPARCDQPLSPSERFDYALMPVISVRN